MSRVANWNKQRKCEACGRSFLAARSDARSCGPTCKKRLQRQHRRIADVPFMAAAAQELGPVFAAGAWRGKRVWKQGEEVTWLEFTRWKPGRINWHSSAGDECRRNNQFLEAGYECFMLPVEDLTGTRAVPVYDVRPA